MAMIYVGTNHTVTNNPHFESVNSQEANTDAYQVYGRQSSQDYWEKLLKDGITHVVVNMHECLRDGSNMFYFEKVFILDNRVRLEPLKRSNDKKCSAADSIDLHNGDASFGMQNEPSLKKFIFLVDGRFTKKNELNPRWCSFIHDEYDVFSYHMTLPEKERKGIDMDELMAPYKDK